LWWARWDLNPRSSPREGDVLPARLPALASLKPWFKPKKPSSQPQTGCFLRINAYIFYLAASYNYDGDSKWTSKTDSMECAEFTAANVLAETVE
jgi:hypothetical protein